MRLIDADRLDMSVKVDGDRTLSPISQLIAQTIIENAQTIESDEDCIGRQAVLDMVEDMTDQFGNKHRVVTEGMISLLPPVTPKPKTDFEHKAEIVISQLRADRDRLQDAIEKIKSEIKEWYWQADKQALAKDPCVVDAMVDLFIRTINKYTAESEE